MFEKAKKIIKILKDSGKEAYLVGGGVRDRLMGEGVNDYDIATNATPDEIEKIFDKTIPVGKEFGIVVVVIEGEQFEVATFRSDGNYSDGRHPDSINFVSAKEDVLRRDFTINGLFYDVEKDKIVDYVDGKKDIENKIIRFIGDPDQRIKEDYIRILRGIRFANRFGFKIENKSYKAIKKYAKDIFKISKERIISEFLKMLKQTKSIEKLIYMLEDTGLLEILFNDFYKLKKIKYKRGWNLYAHSIFVANRMKKTMSDKPIYLFASLFHELDINKTEKIMKFYKMSNENISDVKFLIKNHLVFLEPKLSTIKKIRRNKLFSVLIDLIESNIFYSKYKFSKFDIFFDMAYSIPEEKLNPKPLITGKDLIDLNLKPSPFFKRIIEKIEEMQLEEKINTKIEAINFAKKMIKSEG